MEWVAFPFSRGSSWPRDLTQVSRIAGRFFTSWATREVHRNMCSLLVGMQNGTTTLQNRSEFSYKTKYVLTLWFRNQTLWYLTKWIENVCPSAQKFYSSLYVISETWKQPKCSTVGKWIDKMWYETMEFKTKKKWAIKPWNTWRTYKCILLRERSQSEKAAYYLIPLLWHSEKDKIIGQ